MFSRVTEFSVLQSVIWFKKVRNIFEKQDRTSVWKNVEKLEPLCIAGRNVK